MSIEAQMSEHAFRPAPHRRSSGLVRVFWRGVRGAILYLLPLALLAGAIAGAIRLVETAPKAERRTPQRQATPVSVLIAGRAETRAEVRVMGTVVPSQQVLLQPRVSGEIVKLSPRLVPGGRFKAGEFMLQIDPQDYELAVRRTRSQIAQAEYDHRIEQGYREIAEREWALLDMQDQASELDRELALRKPHLLRTDAMLEAARATLKSAELDLERTTVRAPFNCMVVAENVDLGAQVSPSSQLATLVGTDEYWVQAAVPIDQLHWITFPDDDGDGGSDALVKQELGTGVHGEWTGRVVRLLGDLEPRGRMARVLVAVPDPLHIQASDNARLPLLIDAYVNVSLAGKPIQDVVSLPRTALRADRQVWIMNDADELEIRDVEIVWGNQDTVLVRSGVSEGQRVVVTDVPAPVRGMALRLLDD